MLTSDIKWHSSQVLKFTFYGDDSNAHTSNTNIDYLMLSLNEELAKVHDWILSNKPSLSTTRITYVLLSCEISQNGLQPVIIKRL